MFLAATFLPCIAGYWLVLEVVLLLYMIQFFVFGCIHSGRCILWLLLRYLLWEQSCFGARGPGRHWFYRKAEGWFPVFPHYPLLQPADPASLRTSQFYRPQLRWTGTSISKHSNAYAKTIFYLTSHNNSAQTVFMHFHSLILIITARSYINKENRLHHYHRNWALADHKNSQHMKLSAQNTWVHTVILIYFKV